jgi:hypothetical protein
LFDPHARIEPRELTITANRPAQAMLPVTNRAEMRRVPRFVRNDARLWSDTVKVMTSAHMLVLAGSLMVSYVRARSEGLGQPITDGWFTRAERVVLVSVALMIDMLRPALWILAVLTVFTAFQRLWIAGRLLRRAGDGEEGNRTDPPGPGEGVPGNHTNNRERR